MAEDRKSKIISIRLSDEEYRAVKSRYRTHGAHNISDLARIALQRLLEAACSEDQTARDLGALAARVQTLESQMASVLQRQMPGTAV